MNVLCKPCIACGITTMVLPEVAQEVVSPSRGRKEQLWQEAGWEEGTGEDGGLVGEELKQAF